MKLKAAFSVIILLILSAVHVFAQPLPCEGNDIDGGNCPLDTWVVALAIVASSLAAVKLYRNKRSVL